MAGFGSTLLAEAAAAAEPMTLGWKVVIAAVVAILSYLLGIGLARKLRLPDFGGRIALALCSLTLGIAVCVLDWPPKKGIDLSGGVVLIYEVDYTQQMSEGSRLAVRVINDRIEKLGDIDAAVSVNSKFQIEVVVPDKSAERAVANQIASIHSGAFTLIPAGVHGEGDKRKLVYDFRPGEQSFKMTDLISAVTKRINPSGVLEVTVRSFGNDQIEVIIPDVDTRAAEDIKRLISTSGLLEFWILADQSQSADRRLIEIAKHTSGREVFDHGRLEGRWVRIGRPEVIGRNDVLRESPNRGTEVLVKVEPTINGRDPNVKGKDLARASAGFGMEGRTVDFSMTSEGAAKFGRLTDKYKENPQTHTTRRLGIVLDDKLLSAPTIRSKISDNGQITGNFSEREVNFLVEILNAGSLPAALSAEPVSEQVISAQLGEETVDKGCYAMVVSTICVLVFMLVYYRFAGIVADLAVIMNMVLTLALMLTVNAAITLPGLAGFVLTVGMAVDANVLIYERMREESSRGASLRMTIRNGFSRAMSTIIDSNLTTVISGVVLFIVGTDQVRGFAVTLVLGLMVSLYTAVYVARVIFDVAERKRWLVKLNMMQLIGETRIDFVKIRGPAIAASVVVIAIGMGAVVKRGSGLLDIDFTGGSSVQALFEKPKGIAEVRNTLADLPDLAVSRVGDNDREFKIDTSEPNMRDVEKTIAAAFGKELAYYHMDFGPLKPYVPDNLKESEPKSTGPTGGAKPAENAPVGQKPAENPPSEQKPAEPPAPPDEKSAAPAEKSSPPAEKSASPTEKSSPPADGAAPGQEGAGGETPAAPSPNKGAQRIPARDAPSPALGMVLAPISLGDRVVKAAMGAPLLGLLQAADTAAPAADPPPVADPPVEKKPAETTAAEKAPADPPPASQAPAAESPAGRTPAEASPASQASAETSPAGQTASPPPANEGVTTELTFPQPISFPVLEHIFEERLKEMKREDVRFELSNDNYKPGSSLAYPAWTLRIMLAADPTAALLKDIQSELNASPVFPSSNQIGGKVAGPAAYRAVYALIAAMGMIVIYVWVRFQNVMFGLAAVLALVHDVLVTIGFLALSTYLSPFLAFLQVDDFKISLSVVAALLTIIGYSINDTIVIFDRIREIRGKSPDLNEKMINLSVNQTLGRTLLTSGTVLIGTVILYFFGGQGIHAFAYAMLVGLISGTYSTVYIASPVLLWLRRGDERGRAPSSSRPGSVAATGGPRKTAG